MHCIKEAHEYMVELVDDHGVETAKEALTALEHVKKQLSEVDIHKLIDSDLHEFADTLQQQLTTFTKVLAEGCFGKS